MSPDNPIISDQHGIILSAWTEEQPYALGRLGYVARNIQHCVGGGRHNVWVKIGLMDANNFVGRESIEHKGSTLEIAGELVMNGLPAVVNVEEGVDVSTTIVTYTATVTNTGVESGSAIVRFYVGVTLMSEKGTGIISPGGTENVSAQIDTLGWATGTYEICAKTNYET